MTSPTAGFSGGVSWTGAMPFGFSDLEDRAADRYVESAPDPLVRDDEVRCCIRRCDTWLPRRRRGKAARFCPTHGVSVSRSPTYVFEHQHSNLIVAVDRLERIRHAKVESRRLGSESSEDALSWNVFVSLAELGLLPDVLTELGVTSEVELYLWGNRVWPGDPAPWDRLVKAREELEAGLRIPTEPDIILRIPDRLLILIEAKFGSPNGTLEKKGRSEAPAEFLRRYPTPAHGEDPLNRAWISMQPPGAVLEQLCRNVVFAQRLAESGERACVVNLTREDAEREVEERMARHIAPEGPVCFRRLTWESLHAKIVAAGSRAERIARYLADKTLRLRRAFRI